MEETFKRNRVVRLIEEKENLERKINEYGEILRKNNSNMSEPLVDCEGYPRDDIDVRSVRIARNMINCFQNDLKEINKLIEEEVKKYFTNNFPNQPLHLSKPHSSHQVDLQPFLKVILVDRESPGDEAGIRENDLILSFGSTTFKNFRDLNQISELVKSSENCQIKVKLQRNNMQIDVELTPKSWKGHGLLGFKVFQLIADP